jgi:hypothetical protein
LLMEFSWLMELQRAEGVFVLPMRNSSCPPHCRFQIWSPEEQDRNVMPVLPWMSWQGNIEEKSNLQIWKSCQETATQVAEMEGWGLRRSAYVVWPMRKNLVVMSQWAHYPWSPDAATVWPVARAAQSAKQKEAGLKYPSLVWKTSQLCGA